MEREKLLFQNQQLNKKGDWENPKFCISFNIFNFLVVL